MRAEVRLIRYVDVLEAPNADALIAAYAAECSIPDAKPQGHIYESMERAGTLQCFGAYVGGVLIGFASVLSCVMPHHGKKIATIESIFVDPDQRFSGAGDALLLACEQYSEASECTCLIYTPRKGSRMDKVLSRRSGCIPTHTAYTRWF